MSKLFSRENSKSLRSYKYDYKFVIEVLRQVIRKQKFMKVFRVLSCLTSKHCVFFLLIFLFGCTVPKQWVNNFNEEGSPLERSVRQMAKDIDGNIWLVAYDGNLYTYEQEFGDWMPRFPSRYDPLGHAQSLGAGSDGSIWVGTTKGLGQYLPGEDKWLTFGVRNGLINQDIRVILEDNTGRLWAGTGGNGVFISEDNGETWWHLMIEEGFSDFTVHTIFQDSQNHIWVAGDGLYRYNPNLQKWFTYTDGGERFNKSTNEWESPPAETIVLADDFVFDIWEDESGNLWFGTLKAGVIQYNPESGQWKNFTVEDGLINNTVRAISEDSEGKIWFGTDKGVSRFNPTTNEWKSFNSEDGFTDYNVTSIVMDETNKLWFSTFGNGVFIHHPKE